MSEPVATGTFRQPLPSTIRWPWMWRRLDNFFMDWHTWVIKDPRLELKWRSPTFQGHLWALDNWLISMGREPLTGYRSTPTLKEVLEGIRRAWNGS